MNETYRNAIVQMEEQDVQDEYILGWQGGFLGHPPRDEQQKPMMLDTKMAKRKT